MTLILTTHLKEVKTYQIQTRLTSQIYRDNKFLIPEGGEMNSIKAL